MTGVFITLEGGEGTGKSTQAKLLSARLSKLGISNIVTREPGGTPEAEKIRSLLVHGAPDRWTAMSELCLINAARADHVAKLIRPTLLSGAWVICDRFIDSTTVYQGYGKGISYDLIETMHTVTTNKILPDLTIILEVAVTTAFGRISKRKSTEDRFESHDDLFHYRVAEAFREISKMGKRYRLIDGSSTPEAVSRLVWDEVKAFAR